MGRYQRGYIYEAFGAFHVRYRTEEIVDGKLVRKQRSHRLCIKDKDHPRENSKSVRRLCDEFMATINAQVPGQPTSDLTVVGFWEATYWPFVLENLKPSTQWGYNQVWSQHLKSHFGKLKFAEYRTSMGSVFLTALSKKYSKHTVQHVKGLCSGIFSHAVNLGHIETNPWHEAKVLGKQADGDAPPHYTLEEIENLISGFKDRVDYQLIMALSYFAGLRHGEILGLQWGDIDADFIHIRRNIVRGQVTTPKSKKSVRDIPLINQVRVPLLLWRAKAGEGDWVFSKSHNKHRKQLPMRLMGEAAKKAGCVWKAVHAGRRGTGTILRKLTGNSTAGQNVLGHTTARTTETHYEGALPEEALRGMRLLEGAKVANTKESQ